MGYTVLGLLSSTTKKGIDSTLACSTTSCSEQIYKLWHLPNPFCTAALRKRWNLVIKGHQAEGTRLTRLTESILLQTCVS